MKQERTLQHSGTSALIYCRVSSTKQKLEGGGLDSQEHRCRAYAAERGYDVEMVFPDDVTGGGNFMKRPGMRAMLAYMEAQPGKRYVVIFDDLKRFARDTQFHWALRDVLAKRGATVESPNFRFEDTPEGRFIETMFAAQGELEREQNRRQVIQKMKARVESGFWVFRAPVGYKYVSGKGSGGKVLVPDEPLASVVREALEGFACGRFASQAEVQRFLERDPFFPKDNKNGTLRPMTVTRLLRKVVYAGYVEAPAWGVSLRRGNHDPLISFETHEKILDHLDGRRRRPAARKDFNEDFPLRGFVLCNDCGHAMTAAWSKGCRQHYAYYRCETRGCVSKSKSVARAKLEGAFVEILKTLQPSRQLFDLAKAMLRDAWDMRLRQAHNTQAEWQRQLHEADKQIDALLDRIVEASNPTIIAAYEKRLAKLERQKFVLAEKIAQAVPPKGRLEEVIELSLRFLSSPWNIYQNGQFQERQTVLRLAFTEPLRYCRNEGFGTPNLSFPFKALGEFLGPKSEMVLRERIELSTSPLPRECSTTELPQRRVQGRLDKAGPRRKGGMADSCAGGRAAGAALLDGGPARR